jgi:hypothetical protein
MSPTNGQADAAANVPAAAVLQAPPASRVSAPPASQLTAIEMKDLIANLEVPGARGWDEDRDADLLGHVENTGRQNRRTSSSRRA